MKALLTLILIAMTTMGFAQQPKKQSATIKTPTVQCEMCKGTIETMVPKYVDGLIKITVSYRGKTTKVQWYPDRTNIEEIKAAIANAGYDADDVAANPDSVKKLPKCCKKPE